MSRLSWILLFLFAVIWIDLAIHIASVPTILSTCGTVLLFALPGLPLGFAMFGTDLRRHPESLLFGTALGLGISGYTSLLIAATSGWNTRNITAGILAVTLLSFLLTRQYWRNPLYSEIQPWDSRDYAVLLGMAIIVVLFVTIPFLHVGKLSDQGYGYAWLFGLDFLVRGGFVASLSMGYPPDYLYLTGMPLRLYLVGYVAPAFTYSVSGKAVPLHSMLLMTEFVFDMILVACLFATLRRYVRGHGSLIATAGLGLLAYSYYAWFVAARHFADRLPGIVGAMVQKAAQAQQINDVSHLLQRSMMVEPQAVLALAVFLFMLYAIELPTRFPYRRAVIFGLALTFEFGIDAWLGLVAVMWFGFTTLIPWVRDRKRLRSEFKPLVTTAAVCGVATLGYFVAGVYQLGAGHAIRFAPNKWLFVIAPAYYVAELGPVLLLGIWGLVLRFKNEKRDVSLAFLVLVAVALFQDMFIEVYTLPRLRIGNRLLPIALLIFSAYFFEKLNSLPRRRAYTAIAAVLVLLGVPTVATDIYSASDTGNLALARFVAPEDREACDWLRRNTPETAVIQSEPDYIGQRGYGPDIQPLAIPLIADFADRRMVVGEEWISRVIVWNSADVAHQRFSDIHRMFRGTSVNDVAAIVAKYGIDYLYVGQYEQRLYPQFLAVLQSAPQLFEEVYSRNNTHVFRCRRIGQRMVSASMPEGSHERTTNQVVTGRQPQ